jgi:hypothetical protein
MAASVHKLQLVHSATSMIMFHFFIAVLYDWSFAGLVPAISINAAHPLGITGSRRFAPVR